jgi:uncharacterized repeat protein (TIGR01451 family)
VEGNVALRQVQVVRENVDAPSLSPDGTRLAFKKEVGGDISSPVWRFHVLDLATMTERPLAERRSIDDQIEWLDNEHVLYGDRHDTWISPADGSGRPRRFMSKALSLAVIRGPAASHGAVAAPPVPYAQTADGELLVLPETDLSVAITADPNPKRASRELTSTVTVTNHGPNEATWLVVDYFLPDGTSNVGARLVSPPGASYGCAQYPEEGRVRCDTPVLAPGAKWILAVTVSVPPGVAGTLVNWAVVGATENDPNPANDAAELKVNVGP